MKTLFKKLFVFGLVTVSVGQVQAQVKEYHPILTEEEVHEDASLLSRVDLENEIRQIQAQLQGLRAEALLQDDTDTLQEITFLIHYGDKALQFEDLRLMKKERDRLQRALRDMRTYLGLSNS